MNLRERLEYLVRKEPKRRGLSRMYPTVAKPNPTLSITEGHTSWPVPLESQRKDRLVALDLHPVATEHLEQQRPAAGIGAVAVKIRWIFTLPVSAPRKARR